MNFLDMLRAAERENASLLCVGLDPDPARFPAHLRGDASRIFDFCAAVVDATADLVIAFKPQIAYFAAHRAEEQLERLMAHMRCVAPRVPVILDAKRGDIGSTAEQYAIEAFERYGADAVTLRPPPAPRWPRCGRCWRSCATPPPRRPTWQPRCGSIARDWRGRAC